MENKEYIKDVCCETCAKNGEADCPIIGARVWSKFDYCSHFREISSMRGIADIIGEKTNEKN